MNSPVLTSTVTALANILNANLTSSQITVLAAILVQLGDTLATIAVTNELYAKSKEARGNV